MTKKRYVFLVLILGLLIALNPFSIDMYLPAFGDIAKQLHTVSSRVDLSLSSYFIGLAFGQLLYGPLMDRFGRKAPLYFGLSIYIKVCVWGATPPANAFNRIVVRSDDCIKVATVKTWDWTRFRKDNTRRRPVARSYTRRPENALLALCTLILPISSKVFPGR